MTIEALETKVTNIARDLATLDEDVTRIEDRVAELLLREQHTAELEELVHKLQARIRKLEALAERSQHASATTTTTRIVSPVSPEWFEQVEQRAAQGVDGWRMEAEAEAVEPETDSDKPAKTRAPRKPNGTGAKLGESVLAWAAGRGPFSRAEALAALPGWTEQQMSVALRALKKAGKLTMTGDRSTARYVLP
jgi:predicted  nucleic acid-binding Zn-ribbon protein